MYIGLANCKLSCILNKNKEKIKSKKFKKPKKKYKTGKYKNATCVDMFPSQAGDEDAIAPAPSDVQSQTMAFHDQMEGYSYSLVSTPDPSFGVTDMGDCGLEDFFKRPIKIADFQWSPSTPFYHSFNPWAEFWNNPRNVNRISNFALLRCKLRLKVVINGNGFYYGRCIMSYNPLVDFDEFYINRQPFTEDIVAASQRPHIYIDPTTSQGGEMTLPFFWMYNNLLVPKSQWDLMGSVVLREINVLKHANGAASPVTISVFAWAEDVVMSIPTMSDPDGISPQSFPVQAGDEYSNSGPISKPATVLQKVSGAMSKVPYIGPYARATSIASGAVANIAKMFGYCRPMDLSPINSFKPVYLGNMAATDAVDTSFPLTVDSKAEVTVDPRTTGLGAEDCMTVRSIATRESYLTTFDFPLSSPPERKLFSLNVDPGIHVKNTVGSIQEIHPLAVTFAAQPFQYWRGSMKYRFQIVSSNFHKGRLKFVYDPMGLAGIAAEYNTVYTEIVDISETKDFTMQVGWGSFASYRERMPIDLQQNRMFIRGNLPGPTFDPVLDPWGNGALAVYVVNELTVPNDTVDNDIQINVFVSAGDDIEFAGPTDSTLNSITYLRPSEPAIFDTQAGEIMPDSENTEKPSAPTIADPMTTVAANLSDTDRTVDIYFGESISSFRTMLKRYNLFDLDVAGGQVNGAVRSTTTRNWFPFHRGEIATGFNQIGGVNMDLAHMTLLNYFVPAFMGMRGSIRYKSSFDTSAGSVWNQYINRRPGTDRTGENTFITGTPDEQTTLYLSASRPGNSGQQVQPMEQNPVLEYSIPYYSNCRFLPARTKDWNVFTSPNDVIPKTSVPGYDLGFSLIAENESIYRELYVAAGDDFSTFLFVGAPIMYPYTFPEPPPPAEI